MRDRNNHYYYCKGLAGLNEAQADQEGRRQRSSDQWGAFRTTFADLLPANTAGEMKYELIYGYAEPLSPHPGEVYA